MTRNLCRQLADRSLTHIAASGLVLHGAMDQ
jgi:hypothetical protein